ncbi:hypothetical protein ACE6H2_024375 [Prunus campanulata]
MGEIITLISTSVVKASSPNNEHSSTTRAELNPWDLQTNVPKAYAQNNNPNPAPCQNNNSAQSILPA